jgi:hypothetical protein
MSTTIPSTPSRKEFEKFAASAEFAEAAKQYIHAKAFAQAERERVDAYVMPIFRQFTFKPDPLWADRQDRRRIDPSDISSPDKLYLADLSSPEVVAFYAACAKAHREHGFNGPEDACPALIAKGHMIEAENALLALGCALIHVDPSTLSLSKREAFIKLLCSLAVSTKGRKFFGLSLVGSRNLVR